MNIPTGHAAVDEQLIGRPLASTTSSIRFALRGAKAVDVLAFLVPASSFVQFTIVGRLILSEILALALLPWLLRSRDRLRAPTWLVILLGAWFAFQIVTDLLVRSAFTDWTRGWAAIAFSLINLFAILTLAATPRRARIFAFGLAAGSVLGFFFNPSALAASDPWKFAFASSIGFALAAGSSGGWAARRPWLVIAAFAAFGAINAVNGFRSLSGVAFMTATYLVVSALIGRCRWSERRSLVRAMAGAGLYGASALAIYIGLNSAAAANLLGNAAREKFDAQSGVIVPSGTPAASTSTGPAVSIGPATSTGSAASTAPTNPLGVLAGGRAEFLASTQAILDSPILGHGSWARDPKYVELQRQRLIELGIPGGNLPADPDLIPTHSYLLGSWVWAGLAGGVFWLAVAILALWFLANLYAIRLEMTPLFVFVASLLLWSIGFSPYSNTERLFAMYGIVVCVLGLQLIQRRDRRAAQSLEPATR